MCSVEIELRNTEKFHIQFSLASVVLPFSLLAFSVCCFAHLREETKNIGKLGNFDNYTQVLGASERIHIQSVLLKKIINVIKYLFIRSRTDFQLFPIFRLNAKEDIFHSLFLSDEVLYVRILRSRTKGDKNSRLVNNQYEKKTKLAMCVYILVSGLESK